MKQISHWGPTYIRHNHTKCFAQDLCNPGLVHRVKESSSWVAWPLLWRNYSPTFQQLFTTQHSEYPRRLRIFTMLCVTLNSTDFCTVNWTYRLPVATYYHYYYYYYYYSLNHTSQHLTTGKPSHIRDCLWDSAQSGEGNLSYPLRPGSVLLLLLLLLLCKAWYILRGKICATLRCRSWVQYQYMWKHRCDVIWKILYNACHMT